MAGRSGTRRAKKRSLQMCIAEPNIRVRRDLGAFVMYPNMSADDYTLIENVGWFTNSPNVSIP
jgi:hypothetical protein